MTAAEQRLALYQQALDDLATGKRVVEIVNDGERVRFSDANIEQLRKLVQDARQAVIRQQKRNKTQYWGYGGRE
ncbi:MAG TPA: gpW family head-tail joining protein [Thiotrichales bacterium]|nr:gpW family head-tail joining protein [Thiotrichales bacterium]HQR96335.1 gpW family head-tail joining protein [Thiotrichales bacterium]